MNFVEVIIGALIMAIIILGGTSMIFMKISYVDEFYNNLENSTIKLNLINYSNILVNKCNSNCNGYVFLGNTGFIINNIGNGYYYECKSKNISKVGLFDLQTGSILIYCKIIYEKGHNIYNYKISN